MQFELTSNENVYCIELDSQKRVFVAVITRLYPKRHIFSSSSGAKDPRLMTEFRTYIEGQLRHESVAAPERGLRKSLRPFLKQLASRFDDIEGIDKIAAAQAKVRRGGASKIASDSSMLLGTGSHDAYTVPLCPLPPQVVAVHASVASALSSATEREALLGDLDHKTKNIATSAKEMFTNANRLKRAACCRSWKCWAGAVALIILILVVVAVLLWKFVLQGF